jgi:hypothetical protein
VSFNDGEKIRRKLASAALNETVGENCFLARTTPRPVDVGLTSTKVKS